MASASHECRELHSHTIQAVVNDILDAVKTYRSNREAIMDVNPPWREKTYLPLTFTRNFAYRIAGTRLWLSFGRGRPRIGLSVPTVTDSATSDPVPVELWGEMRLCWNHDARIHELHIAYKSAHQVAELDPNTVVAIDEGIINPMTLAAHDAESNTFRVTVINGRHARAVRHRRNTVVAALQKRMSKCVKGSRQWRRYDQAMKRANATSASALRNVDHQVSRKAANMILAKNAGTVAIGDVRGIEQRTKQAEKRRTGKHQRRRLSQWSRGRQERYLKEKTRVDLTHVDESWSSQICPACLKLNKPVGREYRCHTCRFVCHRDVVGAINIWQKTVHGTYTKIDRDTNIVVTYLRATPLKPTRSNGAAPSIARNRATTNSFVGGVADRAHPVTAHVLCGIRVVISQKPRP